MASNRYPSVPFTWWLTSSRFLSVAERLMDREDREAAERRSAAEHHAGFEGFATGFLMEKFS